MEQLGIDTIEQSNSNVFEDSGVDFLNSDEGRWYDGVEVDN